MIRERIIKEEQKIQKITERFGGEFILETKMINFNNPITIKCRAEALDLLFLLHRDDDWTVEQDEPLEALYQFIKKLPKKVL